MSLYFRLKNYLFYHFLRIIAPESPGEMISHIIFLSDQHFHQILNFDFKTTKPGFLDNVLF